MCTMYVDTAPSPQLQGVTHASGSGAIHINTNHKSVAPTTAMPTTVAVTTSVQPVADGIQGDGKVRRSPSPRGGEEQVRAKRLRLLAEQRQKKEQLREELGGGSNKAAGRTVAVSAGSKHPPSHEVC